MSLASTIRAAAPHTPQSVAQAFNSRSNSIGFLRWLMAFMVIFSHAGPIAGFYGGEDLGVQISKEQSIGGVAVAGFFFFSGFLITRSRMGRATIWRYMWRRVLRIFPAFWAALLFTVGILAPIAYWHTFHNISGYLHPATESPLTYFVNNMWLNLGQRNIAGMGENLPYFILHGARDWNGSAWTLIYEFKAYILVAILGLFGALANRKVGGAFALVLIALNALQWMGAGQVSNVNYLLRDPYMLMFMGPFAFGMLFTLYGDKIPMDSRLAWGGLIFGVLSYASGGWNIVGQYGFLYFLMYLAIRLPLQNWEKHGDLSYGIYIYAWPIMAFAAYFHLQDRGWIAYHLTVVVTVHILAYLSWHLIEKPAMSLKNYLPGWMDKLIEHFRPTYEAVARRLTRFLTAGGRDAATPVGKPDPKRSQDLMELLNIGDIRDFDAERQWKRRNGRDRLRVPFAVTPEGIPVVLDIKEAAQQGMGPHGLLIGATGSGKSEVLRTLVLALALTHSPEQLNFVLVDFKGGATFAGMSDLPHVSAMISNLESELSLVDRMEDALHGEMVRRQEILRDAGNYANVTDYEADRIAGKHDFPVLPALFIILDEFSELLTAKPDFGELFVAIGRLGRSLSIHILLSSQRLESGKLKGLDSHLSYRIGLKTFSASESREVLGVTDAYDLPPYPGSGFLQPGTDQLIRFRASYVAAPPPARTLASISEASTAGAPSAPIEILPFTVAPVITREDTLGDKEEEVDQNQEIVLAGDEVWADMSEMDIAVAKMKGKGYPAHQVWLPPLETPDTFATLMPDLRPDPELGFVSRAWRESGTLRVPLGTVDLPLEQRRETLVLDLSGAGGNFAIVGGPQTGKSTALRTIVQALSLTYTPQEVQFYVMDFGGGTFAGFAGAPHVAGVATRDTTEVRTRMLAEIAAIMDDRERYFGKNAIDSMDTYRRGRLEGRYDDGYGDVFLVVDGWGALRSEFDSLDREVTTMMSRGLSLGVHLIVSASRWMDFRSEAQDLFGSRLELHTANPKESIVNREGASRIPKGRPGRGIDMAGHEMMIGLPRADAEQDPTTVSQGVAYTIKKIREHLVAGEGPKLRLLPEKITVEEILAQLPEQQILPTGGGDMILGVEESRLGPLVFNTRAESHLYLFGDSKTGKSTFLRSIMQEITRLYTPDQAKIIAIDMRRSLMSDVPKEYTLRYITNHEAAMKDLRDTAGFLRGRLPGSDVTAEQIRERSWWSGPEFWVLVDDYDLAVTMSGNPIAELIDLLPQASDIGLHVVLTRRMGGAARATFEKVLQMMGDLAVTGILLSGNPSEGAIINGVKPRRAIPGRAQVIHRDLGVVSAQMASTPQHRG